MQQHINLNDIYQDAKTFGDWQDEMGYGYSTVSFEVNLSSKDNHCQILPLYRTKKTKDKETKTLGISIKIPDLSRNNCNPLLVDDTWEYIIGIGKNGIVYHEAYLKLLDEAYAYFPCKELAAVINWVTNLSPKDIEEEILSLAPNLKTVKQRSGAKVIFNVDGVRVTSIPEYTKFWQLHYLDKQNITRGTCGITGEYQDIVAGIMPAKIKGVPGANSSGSALFSFDKTAYQAYNRAGGMNAPMGFTPLVTIHLFINFLVRENPYHYKLKDKVILFWGQQGITLNEDVWFSGELPNSQDLTHSLFSFPKTSNTVFVEDGTDIQSIRFLTLRGNAGRVAIEASSTISTEELIKNYLRFQDCQEKGSKAIAPWQVMKACYRIKSTKKEELTNLNARFIYALLFGEPLLNTYVSKVLHLICYGEGLTLSRLVALRFYLALKQDKNMIKHSEEMINYAQALGKMYWTIGQSQAISQERDHEQTNASSNLWALSQNNRAIANRLHRDAISIYFKRSNTSEKKLELLLTCRKLFDKYVIETSANYLEKFDSDLQSYFLVGWHQAREEYKYMTKSEKKDKGEEE